jgi:hypothetical protein
MLPTPDTSGDFEEMPSPPASAALTRAVARRRRRGALVADAEALLRERSSSRA